MGSLTNLRFVGCCSQLRARVSWSAHFLWSVVGSLVQVADIEFERLLGHASADNDGTDQSHVRPMQLLLVLLLLLLVVVVILSCFLLCYSLTMALVRPHPLHTPVGLQIGKFVQ